MGVPFAMCLAGAPGGDYLSRAIVKCSGAPTVDTAFMGLTSCGRITIAKTLARAADLGGRGLTSSRLSLPDGVGQVGHPLRRLRAHRLEG
jgi:hypothetical protein